MASTVGDGGDVDGNGVTLSDQTGEFTGRYVVVFSDEVEGDPGAMSATLQSMAGVTNIASARDADDGALDATTLDTADAVVFPMLGVAVVAADPSMTGALSALDADRRVLAVEPERVMYAIEDQPVSLDYMRGYRDGVNGLYEQLTNGTEAEVEAGIAALFGDTATFTWGLQATRASTSAKTGVGIRVAVLDTGFALNHPDFAGRPILSKSFVSGQAVQDGHGHGTHCVGTSCGPKSPPGGTRRYGVATNDNILVGKVLSNQGSGSDASILAGIEWAISNQARVISMSLGANVSQVSAAYEAVGRRALQAGSLIIAAAGNNADRAAGNMGFVGMPANSPSIMAVGAVDANMRMANFSARSSAVVGGKVDIAGPGVAVYSSWPMATRYRAISGTSMATPHVAGVAALISQATGFRGAQLWARLTQTARPLNLPSADVGAGLAQAPQ
jgi:subtilisin family serine protease